jgi:predicted DsbA family dithiol-disulfide isomerase
MFAGAGWLRPGMSAEPTDVTAPIRLDLWADIACPWCYLGSARLDEVLAEREAAGETVVVRHRPFELNPGMPPEGVPMAGFLEAKFGSSEAVQDAHVRLTALGREAGLSYDFAAVGKAPSTRLAHHVLTTYDADPRQRAAVRSLYKAYFEDGLDVTDAATIADVVSAATGERRDDVQARLDSPTTEVDAAFALGRELGVSAVPTFVADAGTDVDPEVGISAAAVAVQGAQPREVLDQVLDEARRRASA